MRRSNLLITFIQLFCLSINSIKSDELSEPNSEIETSEDNNNPSFQFPPAHSTLQKYPLIDDKRDHSFDSDTLVSSIRRFPQYPSSQHYPVNSDGTLLQRQPQVISVLSGAGSPHQSVSWNPPATNAPPPLRTSSSLTGRQEIPSHRDSNDNSRFFQSVPVHPAGFASNINSDSRFLATGSILSSPNSFKPSPSVDGHSLENSRNIPSATRSASSSALGLSAGSVVLPSSASSSSASVGSSSNLSASSASAAAVSGSNAPKKDDVVIYYYYYYDDDDGKNTTVKVTSNLDTIPSLEQFDPPEINKPDKALRANNDHNINKPAVDTSKEDEVVAPFRGYVNHFDHSPGLANRPTTPPPLPALAVTNLNHFQSRPVSTFKPVQPTSPSPLIKPSTDVSISVSLSGDGSNDPVSNVFRYGSSVGPRPTFDSVRVGPFSGVGARGTAFQPQFPGQGFRHIPSASTVAPITHPFPSSEAASPFSHPTHSSNLQGSNQPILHHGHIQPVSQPNQPNLPNLGVNLNTGEIKPQSSAATVPSTVPSTAAATSPSTTTTSTIATTTTTTTSTTTTTTPEPTTASPAVEETTTAAVGGRPSFGSRRRFGAAGNRPNPLNRLRSASSSAPQSSSSTSTTTTTTTARPRNRNFGSSLRRPNRLLTPTSGRRKPENEKKEESGPLNKFTTSSTSTPSSASSVSTTTAAARRFGSSANRGRFGATSRGSPSRITSSPSSSSTSASASSSTSAPISTSPLATGARTPLRRPTSLLANRGRQRPSFFRTRNKPAEEVTEMPKAEIETESDVSESPASSSISSAAPASSTESMTNEPVSSPAPKKVETAEEKETSESLAPVSSTTEKSLFNRPRNRNPLFRNRPRPNIFGSRRTNSE